MSDAAIVEMGDRPAPVTSPAGQVARLRDTLTAVESAMKEVMKPEVDYGVVPGTSRNKPSLYKPGAEILLRLFNYGFRLEVVDQQEDWDTPFFRYKVKAIIEGADGRVVAEGFGEANSRESRYERRQCPKCEAGVWDNRKAHQFGDHLDKPPFSCKSQRCDWTAEQASDVPTEFDYSLVNTIVKMAGKRAKVEAVLTGTAASHFFTQDVEDLDPETVGANVNAPAQTSRGSQTRSGGSQGGSGANPEMKCPACGSSVYDNRPDIDSGKRPEKFPAFKCSNRSCTGVTEDGEKVTDGKEGEPFVTWSRSYFDAPSATEFGSDEMAEVQAHIDTGAIKDTQVLPIARRVAREMEAEEPTSLQEVDALPQPVREAIVEAVAQKIGGGE
ncbi:MAG: hypothetical protein ACLFWM_13570 [Actinomycetota bacterium]